MADDQPDQSSNQPTSEERRRTTSRRIGIITVLAVPLVVVGVILLSVSLIGRGLSKELATVQANVRRYPGGDAIPAAGSVLLWGSDTVGDVSRVSWPPGSALQGYPPTAVFVFTHPRQPGFESVPWTRPGLVAVLAEGQLGNNERSTIRLADTPPSESLYWEHGTVIVESAPRIALYVRRK